jgi:hypothetical protein
MAARPSLLLAQEPLSYEPAAVFRDGLPGFLLFLGPTSSRLPVATLAFTISAQAATWCRAASMSAGVSDGYSSMIASVP